MPLKTSSLEEMPSINLTSMIDVVFLLLIFFMVATQFTNSERQVDLQLSNVGELKPMVAPPDQRVISVNELGQCHLDGQPVSMEQLTQQLKALRARYPGIRVVVRADQRVALQHFAAASAAAQQAGVTNIGLAVNSSRQINR
ncbi:MAG: biopolymer transporter ExbD [Pirellulaceae bacterium]|jgi:biopolymer transport protein ExbD|nr:biopolymer transporter ExbD [Pirellulaceae bacterium]